MKQVIIVVPLFFLLLAILYLFTPVFPEKVTHEPFIHADAPLVLTQHDLIERLNEFKISILGHNIAQLDYHRIGSELGFSGADIEHWEKIAGEIADGYDNPLVQTLVGSEFSLAMWPLSLNDANDIDEQILGHLLLVSRPGTDARLLDIAARSGIVGGHTSKLNYGNHTIVRMNLENERRLSMARVKDIIVMSLNEQILRDSLDLYDNKKGGLLDNSEYRTNIGRFEGASFIGYVDFAALFGTVSQASQALALEADHTLSVEHRLNQYRSGLFGAWRDEGGIVDKAVISFDPDMIDQRTKALLARELSPPSDYRKLSRDTIIYHWTNQFDAGVLLDYFDETADQPGGTEQKELLNQIREVTGLSVEQIIDLFGNDLTLAVRGLDPKQLVPLPRFLLSIKCEDTVRLKQVVDTLIAHFDVPVQRKMMGQTELITWGGVVGIGAILPSLLFGPESIIISSNRQQIRRFLGADRQHSLAETEQFKTMSPQFMQPSHAATYLDFAETTQLLQEMISWGGTMMAIKDRELARKSKILIDELIHPVLDGLAMYAVIGSRKYIEGSNIIYESRTIIEDGNK